MIEIPLTGGAANAHQRFDYVADGVVYDFRIDWVTRYKFWVMSIYRGGAPIVTGVSLFPDQIVYRGDIVLAFVGEDPTLENLGASNKLVHVDE